MGHYVMGHFIMGHFVMGRFVCESYILDNTGQRIEVGAEAELFFHAEENQNESVLAPTSILWQHS
jgi:hypothetical protein